MNRTLETALQAATYTFVAVVLATSAGCALTPDRGDAIAERIREHARQQIEQELASRQDELVTKAEQYAERRLAEILEQRGVDPEEFRQQIRRELAAAGIDPNSLRAAIIDDAKTAVSGVVRQALDRALGEVKAEALAEAANAGRSVARQEIDAYVGPGTWYAIGKTAAAALGLSTPIGIGIGAAGYGIGWIRRRRKRRGDEPDTDENAEQTA